ncbi:hypothetical protein [Rhodanobacter sp. TND4FH1]
MAPKLGQEALFLAERQQGKSVRRLLQVKFMSTRHFGLFETVTAEQFLTFPAPVMTRER